MRGGIEDIKAFIERYDRFFVVGHKEPDGDCISSQIALSRLIESMGKKCYLCSAGPFTRTEIARFEPMFQDSIPPELKGPRSAVIIVDCSSAQRVGKLEECLGGLAIAFIDHHSAADHEGEAAYVDASAPSVTFMVEALYRSFDVPLDKECAELLFFGLCTDTGFFRHLPEGRPEVYECAARLSAAGASAKRAYAAMYGGKSLESRKLMGMILSRAEPFYGGALIVSHETLEDARAFGLESRDSDMLYQLLQAVKGCEAMVLIRQESEENCTVGFRSRDAIDVGAIAAEFGGGGHRNAAGLSIAGTIPAVKARIVERFKALFA
jgi:phosphoesterase RecJ-like protein